MAKSNLDKVVQDFNRSWEYCAGSWHTRWNNNYFLYNNNRVKRGYQGITDTFVPITFSTIETMTSALFGTKPRFTFVPPATRKDQNTDILNALIEHYWDKDQWTGKVINWGRGMLREGTSVVYLHWNDNCPRMINVPIRDFFIDPTASSLESARYMGRRYLTTLKELKSFEVIDVEASLGAQEPVMKKKYKNLDKITKYKSGDGTNTDKEEKDMWYGSTVTDTEGMVEVIEWWTADETISIANRSVEIESSENYYKARARQMGQPYPKGIMPFSAMRDYVDPSLFYAKSEVDFISDQQELLNDLTNQRTDAITFNLNPMYTLDPSYAHLIEQIENLPGAVYPVPQNTLVPIPRDTLPPDAFVETQNIKADMRETTASNEIVKGVGQDGGKVTATEINAQVAGAGQRMSLKVTQIEDEGFHRLAKIVFEMVKLYVTEPMMVRIVGKDGISWEEFDPFMFYGEYEPRVQLETTVNSQKQQQAEQAKEMYAMFMGDPEVNQEELKKLVLLRGFDLDPDEVQTLMTPDPMAIDPMTGMPMGAPMEQPMMPPMPQEMMV